MDILLLLLRIIWFLVPAGVSNMMAAVSGKIWPIFRLPLDLGYKFRNKRIFGDHKTVRGMLIGVISGYFVYLLQNYLTSYMPILEIIVIDNYRDNNLLGLVLPAGALLGDAFKSFLKRQLNVPPGKNWFPLDQIDWILGTISISYFIIIPSIIFIVWTVAVGLILHIVIKIIGYTLRLQDEKF